MKIVSLLFFWLTVPAVVAQHWPEFNRHGRRLNQNCNFDDIVAPDGCGLVEIPTADPETNPPKKFMFYDKELVHPLKKYAKCLKEKPNCEGVDNPDVAIAWATMHYICTHWEFVNGAQKAMWKCLNDELGCKLEGRVPLECEGMNDGGPRSDAEGREEMEED